MNLLKFFIGHRRINRRLTTIALAAIAGIGAPSVNAQTAGEASHPAAQQYDNSAAMIAALKASEAWIAAFNRNDANACAESYMQDAIMEAKPFGTYRGREAIRAFWRDLIGKGARNLRYSQIKAEQVDAHTVLISAHWSMNIGGGFISVERWIAHDGRWVLAEDRFEVSS